MIMFILYFLFVVFMTANAIEASYVESKRLCEISAFVFWLLIIIELIEVIF